MKKIIVIAGPTASGKTGLSVDLAEKINAPIISADSRQFYKELSIGTARPTASEMRNVPHYFVGNISVKEHLSSGSFEQIALKKLTTLFKTYDTVIIVGGSGMYIDALVFGTNQLPHNSTIREKWNTIFLEKGLQFLQNELKKKDAVYYKKMDIHNPVRLIRALEVIEITGEKYSDLRNMASQVPRFPTYYFVLDHPRAVLYNRINERVDVMMKNGLLEEVKRNLPNKDLQALNTVGYTELFRYLNNEINLREAVELIKQNTRRYAKRQLTWFRRVDDAIWLEAEERGKMMQHILHTIPH